MNVNAIIAVMMIALMMTGTVSAAAPSGGIAQDTTDAFAGVQSQDDGTDKGSDSDKSKNDENTSDDNTDQQQERVSTTANGDTVVVEVNNTNTNVNNNENVNINDNANSAQARAIGFVLDLLSSESIQELLDQLNITADGNLTIEIQA